MKAVRKIIKYLLYMLSILAMLLVLDLAALVLIHQSAPDVSRADISPDSIAEELSFNGETAKMSAAGCQAIDEVNGFGLLIASDGSIIWQYRAPAELPACFSLCDVASFSRWYLNDYPVYSWIVENSSTGSECLLVLGLPKNSLWRYDLIYDMPVLYSYGKYFPSILLFNLLAVLVAPFFLVRRSEGRRERERTEWIAGVSHDIRTPLALAVLNTEKIIGCCPDPASTDAARQVLEQEMRLKSLVENLNADNKLLYGHGKRRREKICLPAAIREVVCAFADANESHAFICDIASAAENCLLRADPDLLRRLLENLISNSIRHNPAGCRISVSLQPLHGGRRYLLTVRDDGQGVSPQKLQELNAGSQKQTLGEHGLGLRVVRHIAQAYRWQLHYASVENDYFECRLVVRR